MRTEYRTKVVGVTYENRQQIIKKHIRPGAELLLGRERDNPHGKNATSVWYEKRGLLGKKRLQIGYLSSDLAADLAPLLDAKWRYSCVVSDVTGGTRKKPTRGVNIHINLVEPE